MQVLVCLCMQQLPREFVWLANFAFSTSLFALLHSSLLTLLFTLLHSSLFTLHRPCWCIANGLAFLIAVVFTTRSLRVFRKVLVSLRTAAFGVGFGGTRGGAPQEDGGAFTPPKERDPNTSGVGMGRSSAGGSRFSSNGSGRGSGRGVHFNDSHDHQPISYRAPAHSIKTRVSLPFHTRFKNATGLPAWSVKVGASQTYIGMQVCCD